MDDRAFIEAFEACSLPFEQWSHRAHVKVAYLYAAAHPFEEAVGRMRRGVKAYNAANKVPEGPESGYHETMTVAWMRLIHAAVRGWGPAASADEFCDRNPHLTQKSLLRIFYTRDHIMSAQAKAEFVEPDVTPLPAQA